jgi:hypothetical protein
MDVNEEIITLQNLEVIDIISIFAAENGFEYRA